MDSGVRLGVDVGGTFTDVVLVADGTVTTAKVPTTEPDQSEGVLAGIEAACEEAGIGPTAVDQFRHATTVSTNAMLEGTGAETALVTTEGFGDVLAIGDASFITAGRHNVGDNDVFLESVVEFLVSGDDGTDVSVGGSDSGTAGNATDTDGTTGNATGEGGSGNTTESSMEELRT
jgi:N-methylhydantoinase A/oxoprolinase/acetone carboxylase beta subunit